MKKKEMKQEIKRLRRLVKTLWKEFQWLSDRDREKSRRLAEIDPPVKK